MEEVLGMSCGCNPVDYPNRVQASSGKLTNPIRCTMSILNILFWGASMAMNRFNSSLQSMILVESLTPMIMINTGVAFQASQQWFVEECLMYQTGRFCVSNGQVSNFFELRFEVPPMLVGPSSSGVGASNMHYGIFYYWLVAQVTTSQLEFQIITTNREQLQVATVIRSSML